MLLEKERKAAEKERKAAEKAAEEERKAAEKATEEERKAAEKAAEEERKAAARRVAGGASEREQGGAAICMGTSRGGRARRAPHMHSLYYASLAS